MKIQSWWGLAFAGLVVGIAGCASTSSQKEASANPQTRQVQMSQEQSKKALEEAKKAQQKATDQAKQAAAAQEQVQAAQQELSQAQEKFRVEQQKAHQAQLEANQATQRAVTQARESQMAATQGLAQEAQITARGEQVISGHVAQVTPNEMVIEPHGGGGQMTFRLTDQTKVRISGQKANATAIRQGEDAQVAYTVSGTRPTALSVQVMRVGAEMDGTGPAATGMGAGGTGTGAQPAPNKKP